LGRQVPGAQTVDTDYVFINFGHEYLPHGLIGLLLAVVFSAAMSSMGIRTELAGLDDVVDIYKRSSSFGTDSHYVKHRRDLQSGGQCLEWGLHHSPTRRELIQFVNIVGSLFYEHSDLRDAFT